MDLRLTLSEKHILSFVIVIIVIIIFVVFITIVCYYYHYYYLSSKDPIVVIVDVPPHAIAGNEGNHGDNCLQVD